MLQIDEPIFFYSIIYLPTDFINKVKLLATHQISFTNSFRKCLLHIGPVLAPGRGGKPPDTGPASRSPAPGKRCQLLLCLAVKGQLT